MGPSTATEPSAIGNWVRISVLGSGSFGIVSLWRCSETNDSIAIKKCKLQCGSSLKAKHKERWCKEVQIMKELDHPNIVRYKRLDPLLEKDLMKCNPTKLPLLPMEYCQKGNLRHVLTLPNNMCGLDEVRVRNILLDISSAMRYLHSHKITHRDIKPENIVLQDCPRKPEQVVYKLIDLGYAKELGDSTISFVGTLSYLAPEIMASHKYSCTVDYWSFGVVAFEIICGVLPFMPRLPAIERYRLIQNKQSDHICVFQNHMGNFQYSSELFKENRISCCLKNLMEIWLRKALHFDANKRAESFPDSRDFFDQMNHILRKKILNVFVVHKYKFYSYEFDECTRLSTVRQWITRDIGILEEEQILLGSFQFGDCDGQTLIANCFIDEEYKLFVLKRDILFDVDEHYHPRLVKLMFNKSTSLFSWHEVKQIYSHCIHYIQHDTLLASAFSDAMNLNLKNVTMLINKVLKSGELCRGKLISLTEKVKEFNNRVKNEKLGYNHADACKKLVKVFEAIEKSVHIEHDVAKNIRRWQLKLDAMKKLNLMDIIKLPLLKEFLGNAVTCFQKTASNSENNRNKLQCGEMLRIVSKVIKLKDTMFLDENLQVYSRHLSKARNYLSSLSSWVVSFDTHIKSLDQLFDSVVLEAIHKQENIECASNSTTPCAIRKPSVIESAVEQTELLSSRFDVVISDSMVTYKNVLEEIESYIEDISSLL